MRVIICGPVGGLAEWDLTGAVLYQKIPLFLKFLVWGTYYTYEMKVRTLRTGMYGSKWNFK